MGPIDDLTAHDGHRRFRVCLVVGQLTVGGLEKQAYLLATALDRDDFDVAVVSMSRGGVWADALRKAGIRVVELERQGHWDWRRLRAMVRAFRSLRPELVYSFNYETNAYARIAGLLCRVPVLVTGERGIYLAGFMVFVERLLVRATERVICNAHAIRDDLVRRVGLPGDKVVVIPNAVEMRASTPDDRRAARRRMRAPDGTIVVGTIARFDPVKNLPMLIRVASRTRDARVPMRFVFVGYGSDEASLRAAIVAAGLEERASLIAPDGDARDLLPGLDLFALTSSSEGLPNTVMEAMAAGLACVCTDVGGCRELVADGITGFLVAPDDDAAFARRVVELASDGERRTAMGAAGRAAIGRDYTVERLAGRVRTLFLDLLDDRIVRPGRGRGSSQPIVIH